MSGGRLSFSCLPIRQEQDPPRHLSHFLSQNHNSRNIIVVLIHIYVVSLSWRIPFHSFTSQGSPLLLTSPPPSQVLLVSLPLLFLFTFSVLIPSPPFLMPFLKEFFLVTVPDYFFLSLCFQTTGLQTFCLCILLSKMFEILIFVICIINIYELVVYA